MLINNTLFYNDVGDVDDIEEFYIFIQQSASLKHLYNIHVKVKPIQLHDIVF